MYRELRNSPRGTSESERWS